jgi:hypothetical protein
MLSAAGSGVLDRAANPNRMNATTQPMSIRFPV